MKALRRALADTFGHLQTLVITALGGVISLVALFLWKGSDMAIDEVPYVVVGFVGAFGSVALLFVWNLACAPYRIQKERADVAEAQLARAPKSPAPPPLLPQDKADHISRVAKEMFDLMIAEYDPIPEAAYDIARQWEQKGLSYATRERFIQQLADLSARVYSLREIIESAIKQNQFDKDWLSFLLSGRNQEIDLKSIIDFYNNAIRELHPEQDPEILRYYNMALSNNAGALAHWIAKAKERLKEISDNPNAIRT